MSTHLNSLKDLGIFNNYLNSKHTKKTYYIFSYILKQIYILIFVYLKYKKKTQNEKFKSLKKTNKFLV